MVCMQGTCGLDFSKFMKFLDIFWIKHVKLIFNTKWNSQGRPHFLNIVLFSSYTGSLTTLQVRKTAINYHRIFRLKSIRENNIEFVSKGAITFPSSDIFCLEHTFIFKVTVSVKWSVILVTVGTSILNTT